MSLVWASAVPQDLGLTTHVTPRHSEGDSWCLRMPCYSAKACLAVVQGRSWHPRGQQEHSEGPQQPTRLSMSESRESSAEAVRPPQGRGRGRPSTGSRSSFSSAHGSRCRLLPLCQGDLYKDASHSGAQQRSTERCLWLYMTAVSLQLSAGMKQLFWLTAFTSSCRPALTPFAQEGMQSQAHELAPLTRSVPRGAHDPADNGPGESTPAAAFGWTGLDERTSSGAGAALGTGRINRWWVAFDARYMQPVFGGPQHLDASTGNSPRSPNARLLRGGL